MSWFPGRPVAGESVCGLQILDRERGEKVLKLREHRFVVRDIVEFRRKDFDLKVELRFLIHEKQKSRPPDLSMKVDHSVIEAPLLGLMNVAEQQWVTMF